MIVIEVVVVLIGHIGNAGTQQDQVHMIDPDDELKLHY